MLEEFGKKSALAQGLQAPVTDIHRLRTTDQRLYLYMYRQSTKTVILGGLKVGTKRLFVRTASADLREIEPVCVLDFYVHESCQRQGVGKALFEHFLSTEGWDPSCLAYDRPSPKLLAFLRKHYGLQEFVPQSNNFVVFNRYFELNPPAGSGSRAAGLTGRLGSRGSLASPSNTHHQHPVHGPRATPPPGLAPPPAAVHPAWGASPIAAPSPSVAGPPPPLGNSPSYGRRWAASNFASGAQPPLPPPFPAHPSGQEASTSGGGGEGNYAPGDSLDAFSRGFQVDSEPSGVDGSAAAGGGGGSGGGHFGHGTSSSVYGGGARTSPPGGFVLPPRSPLQEMLGGAASGGPHARAVQQQLAAMQGDAGGGALASRGSGASGGGGRLGTGSVDGAGTGRGAARVMAVAQRSGAGAADCLVW
ncbi:hypothetical protein GPECTOR_4g708 [Gonium pectorale]|uniref:Alpha-tubulin N-acetyltransferase n=1 Tax=Gonium pectorale TaxID=33097 RepID=A0A150GY62_GONPE|nr:hypothetical protein GPECTOR_4g708 [Gonium pectorale]|eukprot:KXZ54642.1 hypothetical protein GPECTOR_4g708 [Gonium pectorale]